MTFLLSPMWGVPLLIVGLVFIFKAHLMNSAKPVLHVVSAPTLLNPASIDGDLIEMQRREIAAASLRKYSQRQLTLLEFIYPRGEVPLSILILTFKMAGGVIDDDLRGPQLDMLVLSKMVPNNKLYWINPDFQAALGYVFKIRSV